MKRISATLLTFALAACAHVPTITQGAHYVALGSSFAAGTSIGSTKPGTPARCGRSPQNYATLLAKRFALDLVDATCGGATSAHVLGPWAELPPQINAVRAETRLVTITIGGNDISYVRNLMAVSCKGEAGRCIPGATGTEADWVRMEANLREIVHQTKSRAPQAKLVFVDYVTLLPAKGNCAAMNQSDDAVRQSRAVGDRLAAITAKVARETKASLLPAGKLSAYHTACDKEPWSSGVPGSAPGVPWHPNAAGHAAIAEELATMLKR